MIGMENIPWTKPEEHHGMNLVKVRNGKRWQHDEQKDVSEKEVPREKAELGNLAKEFTAWL